jgi:NAD(P)-dependent dehydrogenase (short-subunit alcohol dehydrogenase family)
VGQYNIAVNTVAPDFIPDEAMLQSRGAHDQEVIAQRCFNRRQVPDDMIGIIVFLAGPGSEFITGQSFLVNGGAHFQ